MASVHDLVAEAFAHGSLFRTRGRTVTVEGKRRISIRVQSDIFGAYYTPEAISPYYPDLWPAILEATTERKNGRG